MLRRLRKIATVPEGFRIAGWYSVRLIRQVSTTQYLCRVGTPFAPNSLEFPTRAVRSASVVGIKPNDSELEKKNIMLEKHPDAEARRDMMRKITAPEDGGSNETTCETEEEAAAIMKVETIKDAPPERQLDK